MFATFAIGLLLIIGVLFILLAPSIKFDRGTSYEWTLSRLWGLIPIGLALVILAFSSTAIVQAKEQGVLTTFGKPSDRTLDPGLNTKLPWQKVTSISTARQTEQFNTGPDDSISDDHEGEYHKTILVRLGNGSATRLYASVTWAPNPGAVDTIYADYRGEDPTEKLYELFVSPQFKLSAAEVAAEYNPTADLAEIAAKNSDDDPANDVAPSDVRIAPEYDGMSQAVFDSFSKRVEEHSGSDEPLIEVISATVSFIPFDTQTERKISQYQDAVQETIISAQRIKTAENQAEANRLLAESISKEPGVLTSRCLDLIADGFAPPAAFSCFGPSEADPVVPVG